MLYRCIRFIFRITNRFYFKTLHIKGVENIPKTGPVFLVANHPSSFMDPLVIGTLANRELFFLAKGTLFQNKFSRRLLHQLNMIPIYRSQESTDQSEKNKEVFFHCVQHFAKGGAILVFPEGISITERKINKIKTGTARICFETQEQHDNNFGLKIVVIGLNYSNPHQFQSDLFVNIDEPIEVSQYFELYKKDQLKGTHALTEEIRLRLEKRVIAIQDSNVDQLVAKIELIYKSQLTKNSALSENDMEREFKITKTIIDSVHHFIEHEPERIRRFTQEVDAYLHMLDSLTLNDNLIRGIEKSRPFLEALKASLYLMFGFPVFVFGFVNNYLPFKIPRWTAGFISQRKEFFGAISISIGTLSFLIFYFLQIFLVKRFFSDWKIVLVYASLLPLTGLFAYHYYKRSLEIRSKWKIFLMFHSKTTLMALLISSREKIIKEIEKGKEDFRLFKLNSSLNQKTNTESDRQSFF
jgi:glycerol-3-phosphate O-acyltransferase / dihydroxyacetone phosphate acyltransferase